MTMISPLRPLLPLVGLFLLASPGVAADRPWPAPVPGWVAPKAGEHPRLFFRKADLAEIRKRAATPAGEVMVKRLKALLDGGSGTSLPGKVNTDGRKLTSGEFGQWLTLWHGGGYGMLYQLTGDQAFADLGRQAVEKGLDPKAYDRDGRYAWGKPNGALRAGPAVGALGLAYDLCYDGWDDAFRQDIAKRIQTFHKGGGVLSIESLAAGKRHGPHSNHWGNQIGGAAMALLAISGDPGTDQAAIDKMLKTNAGCMLKQLQSGFGDGGYFEEGRGAGQIGSDTAYTMGLLAWKLAGGKDFITPRRNASMISLINVYELVAKPDGGFHYPIPKYGDGNSYGTSAFERGERPTKGWSNAGQFSKGFGATDPAYHPALLWTFHHVIETDKAASTYDAVSPYPHQPVLALAQWPLDVQPRNPAEVLPWRVLHDSLHRYFLFRNRWQDSDDILVRGLWGSRDGGDPVMVWGLGQLLEWGPKMPKAPDSALHDAQQDGSGVAVAGPYTLAVDFSKTTGSDAFLVLVGPDMSDSLATSLGSVKIDPAKVKTGSVGAGGTTYWWLSLSSGKHPEPKAEGATLVVGAQTFALAGQRLTIAKGVGPAAPAR